MPALPNEIILHIVNCLIPSSPPVAFSPSHPVTHTLISFTLVSSLTSGDARRLLLKHCLYIDSEERLEKLISLRQQKSSLIDVLTTAAPDGLFLAPFPYHINGWYGTLGQHPSIIKNVALLLSSVNETLTRLVIDMPLRSLYPENDTHQLRPILREAFSGLTALEEFCSVQDELFLATKGTRGSEPEVWSLWSRLACLALYNPDISSEGIRSGLKKCGNLTHLVITRSDGLYEPAPDDPALYAGLTRLKRILIVNTERGFSRRYPPTMTTTFLGRLSKIQLSNNPDNAHAQMLEHDSFCAAVRVPIPPNSEIGNMDIELSQEFVRRHAIEGTLWELSGTPFLKR